METSREPCATHAHPETALPDAELIVRVMRREETALSVIYQRYSRLIYAVALRITSDHMVAEEVMQDVFQVAWQAAGSFRPNGNLQAWLVGIARHRAIDTVRSRCYRSRAREELLDDTQLAAMVGACDNESEAFVLQDALATALATLSPKQRQGIDMAYYNGLTHAEIAARLGKPIGTVKSRIHLGLLRLRSVLVAAECVEHSA